jgi:hypothetical protein
MSVLNKSTGVILTRVMSIEGSVDGTVLHEHRCKNCGAGFQCTLPLCDGGLADPDLCPDCAEVLDGIWSR